MEAMAGFELFGVEEWQTPSVGGRRDTVLAECIRRGLLPRSHSTRSRCVDSYQDHPSRLWAVDHSRWGFVFVMYIRSRCTQRYVV